MTTERWHQIDSLFDAALRLDASERQAWLRRACGHDEALRVEVDRLLALDEAANRDGFLTPPETLSPPPEPTSSWPPGRDRPSRSGPRASARAAEGSTEDDRGFTPQAAIATTTTRHAATETQSIERTRLRAVALIYVGICGMILLWKSIFLRHYDLTPSILTAIAMVVLSGIATVLSTRRPLSLTRLMSLELAMNALLAIMFAFTQYRAMLLVTERGDLMAAQRVMQNRVLFTSILILTYGVYAPKNWRHAALVVGVLLLLPFATAGVVYLNHPTTMAWLRQGWTNSETTPFALFCFDAMLLLILAAGSVYGAHRIARLRRQVAEAQQLGQYRLRERIGSGGMGDVYLAEHQLLKRPCALKLIRPGESADPRTLERFEREVRLTATLSHPNTVEIFDYGRTEDGTYYYVMEYLPGLNLSDLVECHGPLPPERVIYLLRQVCLALHEAHDAGLIHRDIKPSNIFASKRGGMDDVAKLLDFGLVLPSSSTPLVPHLSGEGQILGTPLFMSPEQAKGVRELDERSDIYSLGAVAYYLLTGRPPFEEGGGIGVMIAHARDPVVPPSQVREGIPDDLERVVLHCLAKDPAQRFQDAEELEHALAACTSAVDWDQERAALWWRNTQRAPAAPAIVS